MARRRMTSRQREILRFIVAFRDDRGYPPTMREMCREFNIVSKNAVRDHLLALQRKGRIRIVPYISRGITVLEGK